METLQRETVAGIYSRKSIRGADALSDTQRKHRQERYALPAVIEVSVKVPLDQGLRPPAGASRSAPVYLEHDLKDFESKRAIG